MSCDQVCLAFLVVRDGYHLIFAAIAKSSFLFSLLCLVLLFPTSFQCLEQCKFSLMFNIGDSNSDTGVFATAHPLPPPYGRTFFSKPSGRTSDGRLVIGFIASNLSLPFLTPYLEPLGAANYNAGANFAEVAATVLPSNYTLPIFQVKPTHLAVEYQKFVKLGNKGVASKVDYFSRALYTIDIGQNDIGYGLHFGMPLETIYAMLPSLVDAITIHVKALYAMGARSFWVHNTGPIGCLAYILTTPQPPSADQIDEAGCRISYNDAAQYFNTKLRESVARLRVDLPLAAITYIDMCSMKYSLFSHPEKYGFSQPLIICCGAGGAPYNYNQKTLCGSGTAKSCSEPGTKVNWDGRHYTEAANRAIYDLLLTGKFSDPPIAPSFSCNRVY